MQTCNQGFTLPSAAMNFAFRFNSWVSIQLTLVGLGCTFVFGFVRKNLKAYFLCVCSTKKKMKLRKKWNSIFSGKTDKLIGSFLHLHFAGGQRNYQSWVSKRKNSSSRYRNLYRNFLRNIMDQKFGPQFRYSNALREIRFSSNHAFNFGIILNYKNGLGNI